MIAWQEVLAEKTMHKLMWENTTLFLPIAERRGGSTQPGPSGGVLFSVAGRRELPEISLTCFIHDRTRT